MTNEVHLKKMIKTLCHDLRGELSASASFADLLKTQYRHCLDEKALHWLSLMKDSYGEAKTRLLALSQFATLFDREIIFNEISFTSIVTRYLSEQNSLKSGQINMDFSRLPTIVSDESLLTLYISELLDNCANHVAKIHEHQDEKEAVARLSSSSCQQWNTLLYQDCGTTLKKSDLGHIKEAFKTLDATDNMTSRAGLGISMLYRIAELLRGEIDISLGTEKPFTGLQITLRLPTGQQLS